MGPETQFTKQTNERVVIQFEVTLILEDIHKVIELEYTSVLFL